MSDPEGPSAPSSASLATVLTPAAATGAETLPAAPDYPKTDAIVDLWFAQCVQGTEVGRYTGAYNAMFAAKEELKRRLAKEN